MTTLHANLDPAKHLWRRQQQKALLRRRNRRLALLVAFLAALAWLVV